MSCRDARAWYGSAGGLGLLETLEIETGSVVKETKLLLKKQQTAVQNVERHAPHFLRMCLLGARIGAALSRPAQAWSDRKRKHL